VQEVVDATVGTVRFNSPPIVTLTGKGSKTRIVPLWQTTATTLLGHLKQRGIEGSSPKSVIEGEVSFMQRLAWEVVSVNPRFI
jgi:site-specific recombinase XerC